MGFGSYDESEQEQNVNDDDEDGESVTKQGESVNGSDSVEDDSVDDMLEYL